MSESRQKVTFDNRRNRSFAKTVKHRVDAHFQQHGLSKHANAAMVLKTGVLLSVYFGAYGLIISGVLPLEAMWALCVVMGATMAGIGFAIGHDALHGAYSSNKRVNELLGLSYDMVGANSYLWKIIHNIAHHTYTNIHGHDGDLDIAPFIRLSPHDDYRRIHRFQHILAFVTYGFATLFWVFIKDFKCFFQRDVGPYKNKKHPLKEWVTLFVGKAVYYGYIIVIPLLILDVTWWQFLVGFLSFHLTSGLIVGVVFQLAHVVEGPEHVDPPEDARIEENWFIHQMRTTANFARDNRWLSWYLGGLNFQIEHHLFPRICSVHYPRIAPIVEQTAREFGVPYHEHPGLMDAIRSHYRTLKKFGRPAYAHL